MVPSFLTHQKMRVFVKNNESVQYNTALAVTRAIEGTSREKLLEELGLETLKSRRWLEKLCCFYKIKINGISYYLAELIPSEFCLYNTRNTRNIITYSCRTNAFKYSFFPWTINEWTNLTLIFEHPILISLELMW